MRKDDAPTVPAGWPAHRVRLRLLGLPADMRVLLVHNRYRSEAPSGENLVVDQEHAALSARGHEVALFQRHSEDIAGWSRTRRATLPVQVLWNDGSRRELTRQIKQFAPDVVHIHNTFPLVTPSVLHACRGAGAPVVATFHNYRLACANGAFFRCGRVCHECLGQPFVPAMKHGCYRGSAAATAPVVAGAWLHARAWRDLVSAYIFISAAQLDLLAPVGVPAERRFVKHNFVPPLPEVQEPTEHVVAYVGRLDVAKGIPFLMRAWDGFCGLRPGSALRLLVAGGGPLSDDVARWARTRPSVTVVGHVSRAEVARILARSRAAVVPSQWEETFGLVAVEAMAAGTAPLASAHGAFPELVTDGVDGALFAPTDVGALVRGLQDVDDRPAVWDERGRRARRTYVVRFGPETNIDRLLEIYRYAIAHPRCPRSSTDRCDEGVTP